MIYYLFKLSNIEYILRFLYATLVSLFYLIFFIICFIIHVKWALNIYHEFINDFQLVQIHDYKYKTFWDYVNNNKTYGESYKNIHSCKLFINYKERKVKYKENKLTTYLYQ